MALKNSRISDTSLPDSMINIHWDTFPTQTSDRKEADSSLLCFAQPFFFNQCLHITSTARSKLIMPFLLIQENQNFLSISCKRRILQLLRIFFTLNNYICIYMYTSVCSVYLLKLSEKKRKELITLIIKQVIYLCFHSQ